jgi:predicted dehydrogenase
VTQDLKTIRIALLGAGGRGRSVINNYLDIPGCQLAAVVDPSQDSLDEAKAALGPRAAGAQFTTNLDAWLKHPDCDLVTINSWDPQHAENSIACLQAGLNIIVAKPMTQSTKDADAVYRAWQKSGKIGLVDMQIRTTPVIVKALEIIASGAIGKVRLITCMDSVGRGGVEFRTSRRRRRDQIKSWTLAKGVHFLDLLNLFANSDPTKVYASGGLAVYGGDKPNDLTCDKCDLKNTCAFSGYTANIGGMPYPTPTASCVFAKEVDVNDHMVASIQYASGLRASYTECYFTPEYQTTYDIIGDAGALFVRYAMDNRHYLQLRPRQSAHVTTIPVYADGAHGGGDTQLARDTIQAIRENKQIEPSIRTGRQAVALCEAIDQSSDSGMPVNIPGLPE